MKRKYLAIIVGCVAGVIINAVTGYGPSNWQWWPLMGCVVLGQLIQLGKD